MNHTIRILSFVLVGALLTCSSAIALRCGGELVDLGDPRPVVLSKCGEPEDRIISYKEVEIANVTRTLLVETWVYNLGGHEFLYYLVFVNGRLIEEYTGDYGY
ncbi:MAG: DUF2845 domain-containing protein [Desulfovibrionales bacterium]